LFAHRRRQPGMKVGVDNGKLVDRQPGCRIGAVVAVAGG
jgi:hypothetical protein